MAGNMRGIHQTCIFAAALAAILAASDRLNAAGPLTIQDPGTYVVDTANVLQADKKQQLESLLGELERATTDQVKVLTVQSLEGDDVFSFAQRQFTLWKPGQKGKNNGALIVLAVADHKVRIHTGYGLEGALPDSWIGSLSRTAAEQYFRQGNYSDGLYFLTAAVVNQIADDAGVKIAGAPNVRHVVAPNGNSTVAVIFFIFMMVVLIFSVVSNYRAQRRGGRGGFSTGSGWFGGFGGSSGGFGGGSFGGGGSSGGGGGGASW